MPCVVCIAQGLLTSALERALYAASEDRFDYRRFVSTLKLAGFVCTVSGGGWLTTWGLYAWLTKHQIFQAMGDFRTPRDRAEAAARGEKYQRKILCYLRRGLTPAAVVLLAGVVLVVAAESR